MREMGKQEESVRNIIDKIDVLDDIACRLMRCICMHTRCSECPAYYLDAELNERCDVMKINELIIGIQNRILRE